jgi:hypothetical protein
LRVAINTQNLIKEDLLQAGGNALAAPVQNTVDYRKEDLILLEELIKIAEQLANTEVTWGEEDSPEIKQSDQFLTVKIECSDTQFEELGGELSGLHNMLVVAHKQSVHKELLKAVQNTRSSGPAQQDNEQ